MQHTPNWARFTPDATFTHIEAVSELAGVMHVCYRVPVISSRDVVLYEAQLGRDEIASITPQGTAVASAAAVARSILHPHCPTRRGIVRARVTAVTLFIETGEGTQIVSYQQCVASCMSCERLPLTRFLIPLAAPTRAASFPPPSSTRRLCAERSSSRRCGESWWSSADLPARARNRTTLYAGQILAKKSGCKKS